VTKVLLCYYLSFFAAAFAWPTWRIWKREGINALVLPRDDSAHGVIGRWFKATLLCLLGLVSALAAGADPTWFGAFKWAEHDALRWTGIVALGVSLILIVAAQADMGPSWRIGVDTKALPALVEKGVFAWSRNPIFLGMRINLAGLLFLVPSGVTLAIALLGEALITVQVRLEEDYLEGALGEPYRTYTSRVPRWIGGVAF
jgi:protein-S-isoprenylcysteine O-methyltransferase Ste14